MSTTFSSEQNLVRGGQSRKKALKDNFNYTLEKKGEGSISARSHPGLTVSQLAYVERFINPTFSYTKIGNIRGLGEGWDVIDTPSDNPNVPYHVSIMTPNKKELLDEEASNLSKTFEIKKYTDIPNYGRGSRR